MQLACRPSQYPPELRRNPLAALPKAKKTPTKKAQSARTAKPRWSIGLFRNEAGKPITVYVRAADGSPMPYEKGRVNGNRILFHAVYVGMKYSAARQHPLKDSGLKDELVEGSANGKAVAKTTKAERRTK